jgi:hypothetical protein
MFVVDWRFFGEKCWLDVVFWWFGRGIWCGKDGQEMVTFLTPDRLQVFLSVPGVEPGSLREGDWRVI